MDQEHSPGENGLPHELGSGVFGTPVQPQDDLDIHPVVELLRAVQAPNSLQAALESGEIIFRHVFKADERLLKARGRKCSSFRKLAAHPDLRMSSSSLWRAVAIFELSLRFPEICQYVHTGVGHISVVLGLPAVDQFRLLRHAEAECWTRRKLQKVTRELRLQQRAIGLLPTPKVTERLAGLEMLVRDASLDRQLCAIGGDEAQAALQVLMRIRQRCAEFEGQLHSLVVARSTNPLVPIRSDRHEVGQALSP